MRRWRRFTGWLGFQWFKMRQPLDPRTGRRFGDHGTAEDAVDFLLSDYQAPGEETEFLKAWNDGSAFEEWPEFYVFLAEKKLKRGR